MEVAYFMSPMSHGNQSETSIMHLSYLVHGNVAVSMAMRYEADAYCPKEPPYQMWIQYDLRQRSYCRITVVAMVT